MGHFTRGTIEQFVGAHVAQWENREFVVNLSWGSRRPLTAKVRSFKVAAENAKMWYSEQTITIDGVTTARTIDSPPIGLDLDDPELKVPEYEQQVDDVLMHHLDDYTEIAYESRRPCYFVDSILAAICRYHRMGFENGQIQKLSIKNRDTDPIDEVRFQK
jgi:hypothetical protein